MEGDLLFSPAFAQEFLFDFLFLAVDKGDRECASFKSFFVALDECRGIVFMDEYADCAPLCL